MSLRWRLAIILAAIVALAVSVASYAAYVSAERELQGGVNNFLHERVDEVTNFRRGEGPPGIPFGHDRIDSGPDDVMQYVSRDGTVITEPDAPVLPVDEIDMQIAAGETGEEIRDVTIDGVHYRMITSPVQDVPPPFDEGAIQVARDLTEIDSVLAGLRWRLVLIGSGVTVAAALVGWLLARRLAQPIERLTSATEHVTQTNELAAPIDIERSDEVGRLANSFNAMLSALELSRRQQQQLVQDASHELRTPLTTLRANIELLERARDMDPAERQELLSAATFELEELSSLVAELVDLATENTPSDMETEEFVLDELAEQVAERARRRTGREIVVDAAEPEVVSGRAALLERALSNLVDNADKFSPPDEPIEIAVRGPVVEVIDKGPGIPVEQRERVFDRFYRTDEARTLPGSGLGLAIVKQIIEEHGGDVWVGDTDGRGARIGFRLPVS